LASSSGTTLACTAVARADEPPDDAILDVDAHPAPALPPAAQQAR
jgi:hypothetical protein